jgi:CubicO group peptidase (beta-lactamase class C family)
MQVRHSSRRLASVVAALAVACIQSPPPAGEAAPAPASHAARIERIENGLRPAGAPRDREAGRASMRDRLDHYGAPALSLAVIDDYRLAWARAWGTVASDGEAAVTEESLFQAGSVSKPVAALVVAALTRKGPVNLDQPVATLLTKQPEMRAALGPRVHVRHLLTHTSGLPAHAWRGWSRERDLLPSTAEMLAAAELAPVRPPGERVLYSNSGYLVLQLAVEEATGLPFDRVAREELFVPLGLERSSFAEPLPARLWETAVWGHSAGVPTPGKGRMYPAAPAGLWTTPSDLARLTAVVLRAAAGRGAGPVPAEVARGMVEPADPGGERTLAWATAGEGANRRILHGGQVTGFVAYVVAVPERGQGLAVMASSDDAFPLLLEVAGAVAEEYGWPAPGVADPNAQPVP